MDPGILFDLSIGTLSAQDIEHFRRWATYLADDPSVRALCEMRWAKSGSSNSRSASSGSRSAAHRPQIIPHIDSRMRLSACGSGVTSNILCRGELALLADPDTALLFDLKYVEARLMCFDMQGLQAWHTEVDIEEERTTREADKQGR